MARRSKVTKEWSLSVRRRFIKDFTLNMVAFYQRKDPRAWRQFLKGIQETKATNFSKFGEMDGGGMDALLTVRLPQDFSLALDDLLIKSGEPLFWKDQKELKWFRETFPAFSLSEKL